MVWALPEHCFKILCYLALFSCLVLLVPTVGSLIFEHGNLNVLQIHLGVFSQNYFVYLEHLQFLLLVTELCHSWGEAWRRANVPETATKIPGLLGGFGTGLVLQCSGPSMQLRAEDQPQELLRHSTRPAVLPSQRRELGTAGASATAVAKLQHLVLGLTHVGFGVNSYLLMHLSACTCTGLLGSDSSYELEVHALP